MSVLNKFKKQTTVDCYCLVCFKSIRKTDKANLLLVNDVLCNKCRNSLEYRPITIALKEFKVRGLYCYQGIVRDLILQYKEKNDEALAYCFLYPYIKRLKNKYKGYYLVEVASSDKKIKERGFHHVKKIFSVLDLPFLDVIKKKSDFQQKKVHNRQIQNEFELVDNSIDLSNKKILLVDDIITTSGSILACYNLLKGRCKRIEVLVLCYNKRFLL